jgi:AcrR family transcriptional regulator
MATTAVKQDQVARQRQQVLDAFIRLVKVDGLRAVSMLSLATKLGISTKTLYRHFASKSELIQAVVESNDARFREYRAQWLRAGIDAHQRILLGALGWLKLRDGLGDGFWHELQRDHVEVYALFEQRLATFLELGREILRPEIRDGLNADHALHLLWKAISDVPSYAECEKLGLTRKEALAQSIDIWARGSLKMYQ